MVEKNISMIVAIAQNMAIGKDNDLLWHLSDDLKRFKKITSGSPIIMGKNTFLSLPKGALPNRRNIVLSLDNDKFPNTEVVTSIDDALELCKNEKEVFVIGGASIYKQMLDRTNKLYLTVVHKDFDADVFFPEINYSQWSITDAEENLLDEKSGLTYSYRTYLRK